jgi:peptidoglycan/LPS O-acetylase OafA/YrhL
MTDWSPPRTPRGQISRVPQMPGLDGMRALAVVAVMVYHANSSWLHGGFLGVEVFFVISGYLITLLLVAEQERSGGVDLKQFWIRRFRRLLPALFVMLGLLMVYLVVFYREAQGRVRGDIIAGISYFSNWYQIWVGAGYTAAEAFAPLRHLWSLAVEEQFYLLWPLIMLVILRRGTAHLPRMALWLTGIAVGIAAITAWLYVPGDIDSTCSPEAMRGYWMVADRCISINDFLYLNTFSRASGLLLGAAFAMVWRPMAIARGPMRDKGRQLDLLAFVGVLILAVMMWKVHLAQPADTMLTGTKFDPWLFRGGFFVTAVATLFIVAAVTHRYAITGRLLGNPLLVYVGTRSYGLYLYHWPIYQIIRKAAGTPLTLTQFLVAMAITVPITEASYRYVEQPIRQGAIGAWLRRDRRRPTAVMAARRRRVAAVGLAAAVIVGYAGVSIVLAPNRCLGVVECATQEGEALAAAQNDPIGSTTTTTAVESAAPASTLVGETLPPTTLPPTTVPPTTIPPAQRAPLAIGESVMLGAIGQLQAGGFTVYAEVSRGPNWVIEVLNQMSAGNQIGETVVIQSGTNGPVSAEQYATMMSYLTEVDQVMFLTVKANRDWIEGNNQLIWSLPGQYPNVKILDWAGLASTVDGLAGDGIHLGTTNAKQTYANFVFTEIGRPDLQQPLT